MVRYIVIELEGLETGLLVDVGEVLLPRHFWLSLRVHDHPDEAICVDVDTDRQKFVLAFVEAFEALVPGCLSQVAIETTRPAVVSA